MKMNIDIGGVSVSLRKTSISECASDSKCASSLFYSVSMFSDMALRKSYYIVLVMIC